MEKLKISKNLIMTWTKQYSFSTNILPSIWLQFGKKEMCISFGFICLFLDIEVSWKEIYRDTL